MSTNQFRRYLDLLNEADLVPPNTNVALPSSGTFSNDDAIANLNRQMSGGSVPRCAVCGTPQSQHQQLKHQFVAGGAADRPDPVPQPQTAGGANVGRIKKLQAELKAAGADLGATGLNRDGIDGDIGPLTTAAMTQYPDISAKYADLSSAQASTPGPTTPKVVADTSKVTAALVAIEKILAKYKVKLSEGREYSTPASQMKQWSLLLEAGPTAQTPAQQAAQRAGMGMPRLAGAGPYAAPAAAAAKTGASKVAAGVAGKTLGRLVPGVGLALSGYDVYDRYQQSDYLGAGISGLAGIASLFPGLGTWISAGLLAAGLARDALTEPPTVAISPEDAKTIADNIKIIQNWQENPANKSALTPDLQSRIDAVLKDVVKVGVPTQTPTPATPATSAAREAAVQDTLNRLDALLKTQTFESINVESLSEQMARHRDIVTEGIPWTKAAAEAAALAKSSKAYEQARQVIMNSSGLTGKQLARELNKIKPQWFAAEKSATEMASDMLIMYALKLGIPVAGLGIVGALGYVGYQALKYYNAPKTMSAAEQAEFNQLRAKLSELVPDVAALNSLSPALQQEYADFVDQLEAMEARTKKPQGTK